MFQFFFQFHNTQFRNGGEWPRALNTEQINVKNHLTIKRSINMFNAFEQADEFHWSERTKSVFCVDGNHRIPENDKHNGKKRTVSVKLELDNEQQFLEASKGKEASKLQRILFIKDIQYNNWSPPMSRFKSIFFFFSFQTVYWWMQNVLMKGTCQSFNVPTVYIYHYCINLTHLQRKVIAIQLDLFTYPKSTVTFPYV